MVTVVVISTVVTNAITIYFHRLFEKKQLENTHEQYLELADNRITQIMLSTPHDTIRTKLKEFISNTNINFLSIISTDGTIDYVTNPYNILSLPSDSIINEHINSNKQLSHLDIDISTGHHVVSIFNIDNHSACNDCHSATDSVLGYLVVDTDFESYNDEIYFSEYIHFFMSIFTLTITILIIYFVHIRFVIKNISSMTDAITEVERGNFKTHINIQSKDEMGELAESFNNMIDKLNDMRDEIDFMHQKRMERADRLASVGELAAGMAHEIKNPISGISNAIQVIMDDMSDDNIDKPIYNEMLIQLQRINQAINNLLSYSKLEQPVYEYTNINSVIKRAVILAKQHVIGKNIRIKYKDTGKIPLCYIDPKQIEQVLVNIIINGIQAIENQGKILITTKYDKDKQKLRVTIRDNGEGMDKEKVEKVFKPFFTTKPKGTGLGLAICDNIIRQHNGTIEVESEVGVGSVFKIITDASLRPYDTQG